MTTYETVKKYVGKNGDYLAVGFVLAMAAAAWYITREVKPVPRVEDPEGLETIVQSK